MKRSAHELLVAKPRDGRCAGKKNAPREGRFKFVPVCALSAECYCPEDPC